MDKKINFLRKPYKGIITRIAEAIGESAMHTHNRYRAGDERVVRLVEAEVKRAEREHEKRFANAEKAMKETAR